MSFPDAVFQRVTQLLSTYAGTPVHVPSSVIVKVRHPAVHRRSEPERFHNEQAALEFLTLIGGAAGPRLLAADNEAGLLIIPRDAQRDNNKQAV